MCHDATPCPHFFLSNACPPLFEWWYYKVKRHSACPSGESNGHITILSIYVSLNSMLTSYEGADLASPFHFLSRLQMATPKLLESFLEHEDWDHNYLPTLKTFIASKVYGFTVFVPLLPPSIFISFPYLVLYKMKEIGEI